MIQVLVIVSHYLPGHKAGGPIRSVANIVAWLGNEVHFSVLTRDRDFCDAKPYTGIRTDAWQQVGKAQVMYLSPGRLGLLNWLQLLRSLEYDVLFLNGFFEILSVQTLFLRRLKLLNRRKLLLAPRGEFSPGALALKKTKKKAYLQLARLMGLWQDVVWMASSRFEERDIRLALGDRENILDVRIAPNLVAPAMAVVDSLLTRKKRPGILRAIFISRIARMKNLIGALRALNNLQGNVTFDIYGPLEDAAYWQECQEVIAQLPANIQVRQLGEVDHARVPSLLGQYDLFLLPTLGENFGHAIAEALAAGCPVLISDRTPWRNLEVARAGFDVPLEQPERFHEILQFFIDMDEPTHREWRAGAQAYLKTSPWLMDAVEQNRRLFLSLTEQGGKVHARTKTAA